MDSREHLLHVLESELTDAAKNVRFAQNEVDMARRIADVARKKWQECIKHSAFEHEYDDHNWWPRIIKVADEICTEAEDKLKGATLVRDMAEERLAKAAQVNKKKPSRFFAWFCFV